MMIGPTLTLAIVAWMSDTPLCTLAKVVQVDSTGASQQKASVAMMQDLGLPRAEVENEFSKHAMEIVWTTPFDDQLALASDKGLVNEDVKIVVVVSTSTGVEIMHRFPSAIAIIVAHFNSERTVTSTDRHALEARGTVVCTVRHMLASHV